MGRNAGQPFELLGWKDRIQVVSENCSFSNDVGEDGIGFYSRPQLEQLPNGSWRAYYPASDWSITAESRDAAIGNPATRDQRRAKEQPGYMVERYKALRRHWTDPIRGVCRVSSEEAERILSRSDPQAEFNRVADEMDAGNITNPM